MKTDDHNLRISLALRDLWSYKIFAEKEIEELEKKNVMLELALKASKKPYSPQEQTRFLKGVIKGSGFGKKQKKLLIVLAGLKPVSVQELKQSTKSADIVRLVFDTKKTLLSKKGYGRIRIVKSLYKGKNAYRLLIPKLD